MKKATSTASEASILVEVNKAFGFEWTKEKVNVPFDRYNEPPLFVTLTRYVSSINTDAVGMGIDPGKNFGMCWINDRHIVAVSGKIESAAEAYAVAYGTSKGGKYTVAIEGASYGDIPGQVPLAEIREAFKLGFEHQGKPVEVVAPSKARKNAFGHGRVSAFEIWPDINHNAADAIGLALYAAGWRDGKEPFIQSKLPGVEPK